MAGRGERVRHILQWTTPRAWLAPIRSLLGLIQWPRLSSKLSLGFGVGLLLSGTVLLTIPLWSGWMNGAAQRHAAATFASRLASGALTASTTTAATQAPSEEVPSGQVLSRMTIPSIGVDAYIIEGLTYQPAVWETLLQKGPAHLEGSALPGQPGNMVVFGHVNVWGSVFAHLDQLQAGQTITLQTPEATYVYKVTGSQIIDQTDVSALTPHGGPPTLQLVTCTGLFDDQRLVVDAALTSSARAPGGVSTQAAEATVARFYADLAARDWTGAQALWSSAWKGNHSVSSLQAAPPPFQEVRVQDAWDLGNGTAAVRVSAMAPNATAPVVTAYTVGASPSGPVLLSSAPVTLGPPQTIAQSAPSTFLVGNAGTATCGPYKVQWKVDPYTFQKNDSFTLKVRNGSIAITGPDGNPVTGVSEPALTEGTYPVACGDLLGDGGEALVTRTVISHTWEQSQINIYSLGNNQATLVGSFDSDGGDSYPRWTSYNPTRPDGIVVGLTINEDDAGDGYIFGPQLWVFQGGTFQPAKAQATSLLQKDLATELTRAKGQAGCPATVSLPAVSCPFASTLVAYYDALELGQANSELPVLLQLLPAAQRTMFQKDIGEVAQLATGEAAVCATCNLPFVASPPASRRSKAGPSSSSAVGSKASASSSGSRSTAGASTSSSSSATRSSAGSSSASSASSTGRMPLPTIFGTAGGSWTAGGSGAAPAGAAVATTVSDVTVRPGGTARFVNATVVVTAGSQGANLQDLALTLSLIRPAASSTPLETWQLPALSASLAGGQSSHWSGVLAIASPVSAGLYQLAIGPRQITVEVSGQLTQVALPVPPPTSANLIALPVP